MSRYQYKRDELRVPATITKVFSGKEDHDINTASLYLEGKSWGQSFGNLALNDADECKRFLQEVCDVFGTDKLEGQKCFALYSDNPRGQIEGLEAPNGKRFTIRGYRLRYYPDFAPTPTEARRNELLRRIASHKRRMLEAEQELAELPTLIDWETEPLEIKQ